MSKTKSGFGHLGAVWYFSSRNGLSRTYKYDETSIGKGNTEMCQEQVQGFWLCQKAGACGG